MSWQLTKVSLPFQRVKAVLHGTTTDVSSIHRLFLTLAQILRDEAPIRRVLIGDLLYMAQPGLGAALPLPVASGSGAKPKRKRERSPTPPRRSLRLASRKQAASAVLAASASPHADSTSEAAAASSSLQARALLPWLAIDDPDDRRKQALRWWQDVGIERSMGGASFNADALANGLEAEYATLYSPRGCPHDGDLAHRA